LKRPLYTTTFPPASEKEKREQNLVLQVSFPSEVEKTKMHRRHRVCPKL
jgi:hypothetical protein